MDRDVDYALGPKLSETPELQMALREVTELGDVVRGSLAKLDQFVNRTLIGELPPSATAMESGNRPRPAFNGGLTGQLRREISNVAEAMEELNALAFRLERIG